MSFETKNSEIVLRVLHELYQAGALDHLILIGSWCLHFYKVYFEENPKVPTFRTLDLDFLVKRPPRVKGEINIPEILKNLEFTVTTSQISGVTKYFHPDIEIEFLAPEYGRGMDAPLKIPNLHIEAVTLRYLHLIQDHLLMIPYKGIFVKVPEPTAFALHKYLLVSLRPTTSQKGPKDLQTAVELTDFLITKENQFPKFKAVFNDMPGKWQKKLKGLLTAHYPDLIPVLES